MKKIIGTILVCLLVYKIYSDLYPPINNNIVDNKPKPVEVKYDFQQALNDITANECKKHVEVLSSPEFEGRGTGTVGCEKSCDYICDRLDEYNIPIIRQKFLARGKSTENIIGYISGTEESIIVIGSHYDHLGKNGSVIYYGADDNASGVSGVLMIAKVLSKLKNNKHTILLQFYSGEEMGLLGSKFYCDNPLFPLQKPSIDKHIAMINLDMIGYLKYNYSSDEFTGSWTEYDFFSVNLETLNIKNIVSNLSSKYSFANNIAGYRPGGSDHAPFYHKGIPVVFLHTGLHNHYHKPSDTPDRLNYNGLSEITKLALEIISKIDNN